MAKNPWEKGDKVNLERLRNQPMSKLSPKELELLLKNFNVGNKNNKKDEVSKPSSSDVENRNNWQNEALKNEDFQEIIKEIIGIENYSKTLFAQLFKGEKDAGEKTKDEMIKKIQKLSEDAYSILKKSAPENIDNKELWDLIKQEIAKVQKKSISGKGNDDEGKDNQNSDTFYGIDRVK